MPLWNIKSRPITNTNFSRKSDPFIYQLAHRASTHFGEKFWAKSPDFSKIFKNLSQFWTHRPIHIQNFVFCKGSFTGADPHMVRIGTGPPFWQINHANSAYFRLFLGYFRVISATRPPPFGSRPPLFTYPGSAPDSYIPGGWFCYPYWQHIPVHRKTRVNHLTHLSHSVSIHRQNDSKMSEKWVFLSVYWHTMAQMSQTIHSLGFFCVASFVLSIPPPYRPGLCILYAGSQWFSTDVITSCFCMCPHGPTMLNKQTDNMD